MVSLCGTNVHAQIIEPELVAGNLSLETVSGSLVDPTGMAFLGHDDILVLEKNKGTVQRIIDGQILEEPILDVNVNGKDERGMLGIAVSKDTTNGIVYVFLFYTEAEEDGGQPIGNRLYRYELVEDKLVNPKLLLDLPYLPGPAHNGGVVAIGPDENVYVVVGDITPTSYGKEDVKLMSTNDKDGKEPDGRGGILRVTQDGEVVDGEGILGEGHPLDKYYAYGIKNSFGIGFDPVTGKLWDTENGPKFGDEINLVEPGFNSGWRKVQGIWTVNERLTEGERDINKGEEMPFDPEILVDFDGKGKYSSPEFSWDDNVGPTAIVFLNSDRLGEPYQNDIFVGSVLGDIYNFQLTENRSQLVLDEQLADGVANADQEVERVIFGKGMGIISDLEVGPDGYLYILTGVRDTEGKIYRIVPITDE